ncbi:MAG: BNR-4 repeat-containing protein, partial [Planctomycetota bacterium]
MLVRPLASLLVFFSLISISPGTVAAETEVRKIPVAKGLASHPVNGGRCLISDGEHQYIAFYDGDHKMTVGKRRLGDTKWDFAKLPERVGWDTHNKIMLFQDRQGHLHL